MDWTSIASIATSVGVFVAAWRIRESRKLSMASFEDSFDQQYRILSHEIPVDALIGESLEGEVRKKARESIYNYLDLCNEQIYLRMKCRISTERWQEWRSGIKGNLQRTVFQEVWQEVKRNAPETFTFLERLELEKFESDPKNW